eukprot:gene3180-3481_t
MSTTTAGSADASTSTKLALIYSRLAELEIQKEKKSDIWEEITQKFGPEDLDPAETNNIEEIFEDSLYGPSKPVHDSSTSSTTTVRNGVIDSEAVSRVRLLFLAEQQFSESLRTSLSEKLNKLKACKSERDGFASEMFRIREEMLTQDVRARDLEELCRSLQKLCKEKDDQRSYLVEQEREKTKHLERECVQSIEAVTKKIEEEEAELDMKSLENEELKSKLDQFSQHLQLRREKLRNEERAKDLQQRLEQARHAQVEYAKVQERLRAESYKSKIRHLEEAIATLQQQVAMYGGKFDEFEDTLNRSCTILEKVEEREKALETMMDKLSQEHDVLKHNATEADVGLIKAMEAKRQLEDDVAKVKQQAEKLERKCRRLLSKRQDLAKRQSAVVGKIEKADGSAMSVPSSSSVHSSALLTTSTGIGSPESGAMEEVAKGTASLPSTPARRGKLHFDAPTSSSSSVAHSPNRSGSHYVVGEDELVGEGSPISSPSGIERKK